MNTIAIVLLAFLALMPACQEASAQTLYPRAARVYLPRLRRLLSFGGIVNRQPQDVIVSLDLSKEWPTSNPLLTPLSITLGMGTPASRTQDMVPVVARNGDSYDIMLYGGMTSSGTRGPKRYMLSTKDGVTLENVRCAELGEQDYSAKNPAMSSVAIVLDEYFKDRGAVGNAPAYIVGGRPYGNASATATATVASLSFDKPANAFPPAIRQSGPKSSEYGGLVYITPSQLMIAGSSERAWTYDLLRMEWREYKGMFPPQVSARPRNQLVTYTAPASGRTYVISVGTEDTGPAGLFLYTDTSTQSNFTDMGPIPGFDVVMFFHCAVIVDDHLVAIGVTTDISNAEQFEPVLVFKVSEPSPGTLAITKVDKFVPSSASAKPIGPEAKPFPTSSSVGLIFGITIPSTLLFVTAVLVFIRHRKLAQQKDQADQPPNHSHEQTPCSIMHDQNPPFTGLPTFKQQVEDPGMFVVGAIPKQAAALYGLQKEVPGAPARDASGTLVLGDMPMPWSSGIARADEEELILGDVPVGHQGWAGDL